MLFFFTPPAPPSFVSCLSHSESIRNRCHCFGWQTVDKHPPGEPRTATVPCASVRDPPLLLPCSPSESGFQEPKYNYTHHWLRYPMEWNEWMVRSLVRGPSSHTQKHTHSWKLCSMAPSPSSPSFYFRSSRCWHLQREKSNANRARYGGERGVSLAL